MQRYNFKVECYKNKLLNNVIFMKRLLLNTLQKHNKIKTKLELRFVLFLLCYAL